MLDDDARYQCQVSTGSEGEPGIRSNYATLSVLVPPDPPKIVQGDYLVTTEDREIELECVSHGGKPAAEITWIDGMGSVLTEGIDYIVDELPDGRRYTAKSILKLTPRKQHHNTTFTCQAQNTAERTHRSAKLKLEVRNQFPSTIYFLLLFDKPFLQCYFLEWQRQRPLHSEKYMALYVFLLRDFEWIFTGAGFLWLFSKSDYKINSFYRDK